MTTTLLGGLAVGAVLGLVGAGGGILAMPLLVYGVGLGPAAAVPAALVVTGASSLTALPARLKDRQVRWVPAAVVGLTGIPSTWLGAHLGTGLDPDWLMTFFSALTLLAGLKMLRNLPPHSHTGCTPRRSLLRGATIGTVVGTLTGIFGVGGGFLLVPALMLFLCFTAKEAAATSLVIIVANSAAGLLAHLGTTVFNWPTTLVFTATAMVASLLASQLAVRVSDRYVQVCFGVLLLGVTVWILASTLPRLCT